jgi:hypothetical protein
MKNSSGMKKTDIRNENENRTEKLALTEQSVFASIFGRKKTKYIRKEDFEGMKINQTNHLSLVLTKTKRFIRKQPFAC